MFKFVETVVMPSPFPGMDPYLEGYLWPDVHNSLAYLIKVQLISRLAARFPQLVAKDAELSVKMIIDAMATSLAEGQRIEIRGFGSFDLNYRPPRIGRNPKSGEKEHVPAKYVPHFKAGKEMRERVDYKN